MDALIIRNSRLSSVSFPLFAILSFFCREEAKGRDKYEAHDLFPHYYYYYYYLLCCHCYGCCCCRRCRFCCLSVLLAGFCYRCTSLTPRYEKRRERERSFFSGQSIHLRVEPRAGHYCVERERERPPPWRYRHVNNGLLSFLFSFHSPFLLHSLVVN